MPIQIFISGKNWSLSLAELTEYLKSRKIKFEIQYFSREFFVVNLDNEVSSSCMDELGGTIKIGRLKTSLSTKDVKEAFLNKNKIAQKQIMETLVSSGIPEAMIAEKVVFGVSIYFTDSAFHSVAGRMQRYIGSAVKDKLVGWGKKASFIGYSSDRKKAQLSNVEVIKKNLVENNREILVCIGKHETYVALTKMVHNPFEFQKRDIYKPNQRAIFAMPPRLARIMVNLSLCAQGKVLFDPFCGVGTILQEALLEGASVIGMDINSWCTKAAGENLEWLTKEYDLTNTDFRVITGEVKRSVEKIGVETVDCIVSEPDLGPALRDVPTGPYAKKIIDKLEPLFVTFIEQAYKTLRDTGRLVMVTPYIKTRSNEKVIMPISAHIEKAGFERVYPFQKDMFHANLDVARLLHTSSLYEVDDRHKIGREIHILQK